jgi:hypothetical protein
MLRPPWPELTAGSSRPRICNACAKQREEISGHASQRFLHHITVQRLRESFYALKRSAADGQSEKRNFRGRVVAATLLKLSASAISPWSTEEAIERVISGSHDVLMFLHFTKAFISCTVYDAHRHRTQASPSGSAMSRIEGTRSLS